MIRGPKIPRQLHHLNTLHNQPSHSPLANNTEECLGHSIVLMALLYKNNVQVESQRQPLLVPLWSKAPAFCLLFQQVKFTQVLRIIKLVVPGLIENLYRILGCWAPKVHGEGQLVEEISAVLNIQIILFVRTSLIMLTQRFYIYIINVVLHPICTWRHVKHNWIGPKLQSLSIKQIDKQCTQKCKSHLVL